VGNLAGLAAAEVRQPIGTIPVARTCPGTESEVACSFSREGRAYSSTTARIKREEEDRWIKRIINGMAGTLRRIGFSQQLFPI
jgi:hypothetical protein